MTGATEYASARYLASGAAGGLELCLFYPVDTIAKRLMNSKNAVSSSNWQRLILQDSAASDAVGKFRSLFPGLSFGAAYKVTQRGFVWGGQPFVKEFIQNRCKLHEKTGKSFCDGLAGSLMGVAEVALLPLNALKTKAQTNPEYRSQGLGHVFREQGMVKLYSGWQWTIARNVPGSFALFGANAFVKEHIFGLTNHRDATFVQTTIASSVGCACSVLVACPFDVVKTRIQSGTFGTDSGMQIVKNIVHQEGPQAFFKGALPKVFTVGPKLAFSFTIAQCLMARFEK